MVLPLKTQVAWIRMARIQCWNCRQRNSGWWVTHLDDYVLLSSNTHTLYIIVNYYYFFNSNNNYYCFYYLFTHGAYIVIGVWVQGVSSRVWRCVEVRVLTQVSYKCFVGFAQFCLITDVWSYCLANQTACSLGPNRRRWPSFWTRTSGSKGKMHEAEEESTFFKRHNAHGQIYGFDMIQ